MQTKIILISCLIQQSRRFCVRKSIKSLLVMKSSIRNYKKINNLNRSSISLNAPLGSKCDNKLINMKTMKTNLIRISVKECMSFGNLKSSKDSTPQMWKLQDLFLEWLICIFRQVKKYSASLIKYSDKKYMENMPHKPSRNLNFSQCLITPNSFKKFIINGKQRKIMINFKMIKMTSPKKICNKLL